MVLNQPTNSSDRLSGCEHHYVPSRVPGLGDECSECGLLRSTIEDFIVEPCTCMGEHCPHCNGDMAALRASPPTPAPLDELVIDIRDLTEVQLKDLDALLDDLGYSYKTR